MTKVFDTESRDRTSLAPPRGKCHVCVEGPSEVDPRKPDARSYKLIGLFMDEDSARRHAREVQATLTNESVVAFGFNGEELYRGKLHAAAKAVAPVVTAAAPVAPSIEE